MATSDNILIADFVGTVFHDGEDLDYHSSWDSLMEVVDFIEALDNRDYVVRIFGLQCKILHRPEIGQDPVAHRVNGVKILAVHAAVVGFIEWHIWQATKSSAPGKWPLTPKNFEEFSDECRELFASNAVEGEIDAAIHIVREHGTFADVAEHDITVAYRQWRIDTGFA